MIRRTFLFSVAGLIAFGMAILPGQAGDLSPEKLKMLDEMGYFTPGFKAAVHELIDNKHALEEAGTEKAKLTAQIPDLQKQAAEAQAQAIALREQLAKYDHPEENDFVALQAKMKDPAVKPEEQIALAQAYIWTYPASPHESDAQQFLQQIQQEQAAERKAIADAQALRDAAHEKLVLRAQARDLNLGEWRDFLRDMSQDDLVKLLGQPTSEKDGYWIYTGNWMIDAVTRQKVGMQINFSAGRVISVDEKPPQL